MYLAETKEMHVANYSSGTLEIRWHRHCNKAVLYFVKHPETRIVAAIFEGAPTEVTQHRWNAAMVGITIWDPPCGPPSHPILSFVCFDRCKGSTRWSHWFLFLSVLFTKPKVRLASLVIWLMWVSDSDLWKYLPLGNGHSQQALGSHHGGYTGSG